MSAEAEVREPVAGDGYAVGNIDGMGEGYGFRKVRRELDVKELGINAIVLPGDLETGFHYHDEQEELYFVHSGRVEIEFGDGRKFILGTGRDRARGRGDAPQDPERRLRGRRLPRRRREGRLRRPGRAPARGRGAGPRPALARVA